MSEPRFAAATKGSERRKSGPGEMVAIYCRVSTDEQQDSHTIRNQVAYGQGWAELNGLKVYDYYLDDGVSGTIPLERRAEGSRLLADARAGRFTTVLVHRLDRFGRALRVILDGVAQLEELGVPMRSMTEPFDTATSIGRFVLQLLGSLAELERETIAERSKLGKLRASREGLWASGKTAMGYRREGKKLAIDEYGAAIVRRIFDLYLDDGLTTQKIAHLFNAEDVPTPGRGRTGKNGREIPGQSGRWTESRVARVLGNPIYVGQGRFTLDGKEAVEIPAPPLISEERFEQAVWVKRERTWDARRNAKYFYLLRGLVKCEHCGGAYMGNEKSGRRYYKCWRRGECSQSRAVRGERLESEIWADIGVFVHNPGRVVEQVQAQLAAAAERDQDFEAELARLERHLAQNEEERQRLLRAYRKGVVGEADLDIQLREVEQARGALEQERARLLDRQVSARRRDDELLSIEELLTSLASRYEEIAAGLVSQDSDVQTRAQGQQREIVKHLVNHVTVHWDGAHPTASVEYVFEPNGGGFARLLPEQTG